MGSLAFWTGSLMFMVAAGLVARLGLPDFYIMMFGAVLQLMILGTAWNILAGYCGYSNFGASAFVGIGAYSSAFLAKALGSLLALQILAGAAAGALLGLMIGLMTIRLRGIHFAIGTLALSVILETCVNNWDYMGGSRGMAIPPPVYHSLFGDYIRILLIVSSALLVAAVGIARFIHTSWIGRGFRAIRDDELAAQSSGVPTLGLKLLATCVSGGLMGAAGSIVPLFTNFVDPGTLFNLDYALLPVAAALIGGTEHWAGPLIGGALFGAFKQTAAVSISSDLSILIEGGALILFVVAAPAGLVGMFLRPARPPALVPVDRKTS